MKVQLAVKVPLSAVYEVVHTEGYDGTMEGLARALEVLAKAKDGWTDLDYFPPGSKWTVLGLPGGDPKSTVQPVDAPDNLRYNLSS